jgi:membrane protein YqaA with SNARE-associated domain
LRSFLYQIAAALFHLGGFGLLILGVLDSSFLFYMPLGIDLLMVAMTARNPLLMPYFAAMATAGSVLGCLLVDIVFRKGGEEMLEKHVSRRRLDSVRNDVKKRAAWALSFASLMPPPFPFTPFVAASAALEYPRKKLLTIVAVARMVRFSVGGTLAILFGRRILAIADSPVVVWGVVVLIVVSIGGSAFQIVRWARRSKSPSAGSEPR